MADFTGADVNHILRTVRTIIPTTPTSGNAQISLLAVALCAAARDCGVDRDVFMETLGRTYEDVLGREMIPLPESN